MKIILVPTTKLNANNAILNNIILPIVNSMKIDL